MSLVKTCLTALVGATLLPAASAYAQAQNFPNRPITIVVPYASGGSNDLIARVVGAELGKHLNNVTVVVQNAPGASGTIGAQRVVDAQPDGYTILIGSPSEISIAKLANPAVRYDGQRDLAPIGKIGAQPLVLVSSPSLNLKTTDDFLKLATNKEVSFGTSGIGTPLHLAGELVKSEAGVKMLHVPYKGGAPAIADIMGGQIEAGVLVYSTALPHIKSGKLHAVGVTSAKRAAATPDVPALAETKSLSKVDIEIWFGLWAPAKTDPAIINKLNVALNETLKNPDTAKKLVDSGLTLDFGTAATFKSYIAAETSKFSAIVKAANLE